MAEKAITRRLKIFINGNEVDATLTNLRKSLVKFKAQSNAAVEGTPEWKKYNAEVARTEAELNQATAAQKKFREETGLTTKTVDKAKGGFASLFPSVSGAILFTDAIKSGITFAKEFIGNSVQMAIEAKGVDFAFERLGETGKIAFEKVKASTRGLLSDLEIKRSLVEFDNFNISLEESATLFEFLSVRATQTGQSVDYLKQSMVEGLSKESKLRIDNLGISTAKLNEELERTPNFVQAVANIAKTEIAKAGNILDEAASSSQKWNATLENTQLKLGKLINNSGVIPFFQKLGTSILNIVAPLEKASEATEKERLNLFLVESKIKDVNTTNVERLRLINELKEKYPTLLKDINAETVSNEELTTALRQVNDQLVNKIILQDKDSQIAIQNEKTSKEKISLFNKEDEIRQRLAAIALKEGIILKSNVGVAEQARDVIKRIGITGGVAVDPIAKLSHEVNNLNIIQGKLNNEEAKGIKLLNEKKGLYDRLNVSSDVMNPTSTTETDPVIVAGETEEEKKAREDAAKKALEDKIKASKDAQDKLTALETQYEKEKLQRLAVSNEQKAQLARDEAIDAATALGAKKDLLDAIEAEHKIKIDAGKKADEDIELQRLAAFEIRKSELLNEIALAKEEEGMAAEILKAEQEYAKQTADLEKLKLTLEEKAELEKLIETAKEIALQKIKDKFRKEDEAKEKAIVAAKKQLQNDIINGAIEAAGRETRVGQALLAIKGALAAKEMLIKLGVLQADAAVAVAGTGVAIAEGTAKTAKVGFPQNVPLLLAFAAQAVGIVAAVKGALGATKKIKSPSFARGGDTGFGDLGLGRNSGGFVRGTIEENEYVIPQFVRKDPEVPQIIEYLEAKRTGKETASSNTASVGASNDINAMAVAVLSRLNDHLSNGLKLNYTLDDERERQLLQKKLDNTINASKK